MWGIYPRGNGGQMMSVLWFMLRLLENLGPTFPFFLGFTVFFFGPFLIVFTAMVFGFGTG